MMPTPTQMLRIAKEAKIVPNGHGNDHVGMPIRDVLSMGLCEADLMQLPLWVFDGADYGTKTFMFMKSGLDKWCGRGNERGGI